MLGRIALLVLVTAGAVGCDRGPKLHRLTGTVNFKGRPAPRAEVRFAPDYTKGNDGPAGAAFAVDGHFDTRGPGGRGVIGGPYKITIFVFDGQPSPEQPHGRIVLHHEEARELPRTDTELLFDLPVKK